RVGGKRAGRVVRVEGRTGGATSRPPFSAATSGDSPCSKGRKMFSITTTELSINREKARASPPRIIVFTELPPTYKTINVASAESGIERHTATVARMLPR